MESKKDITPSDFLKSLNDAVSSGDPKKGMDAIQRINQIDKIVETLDVEKAKTNIDKRLRDSGEKGELTKEEISKIDFDNENRLKEVRLEEVKFKMESDLKNITHDIEKIEIEKKKVINEYDIIIKYRIKQLESLKKKYEENFAG